MIDPRWQEGIWLGRVWASTLSWVAFENQVLEVRAVHRRPLPERWCRPALEALKATPWENPARSEEPMQVIPHADIPAAPEVPRARQGVPRRVYITPANLREHGFSSNCARCEALRHNRSAQGIDHSLACRRRLVEAMRAAGDRRLIRAETRLNAELGDELERRIGVQEPPRAEEEEEEDTGSADPHAVELEEGGEEDMVDSICKGMPRKVGKEATSLLNMFLLHGCGVNAAKSKICELYSPPRTRVPASRLPIISLAPGSTFDLRADENGVAWNFLNES